MPVILSSSSGGVKISVSTSFINISFSNDVKIPANNLSQVIPRHMNLSICYQLVTPVVILIYISWEKSIISCFKYLIQNNVTEIFIFAGILSMNWSNNTPRRGSTPMLFPPCATTLNSKPSICSRVRCVVYKFIHPGWVARTSSGTVLTTEAHTP